MTPVKPYKFKVLVKRLKKYDDRFEVYNNRGKGSERMLYHPNIQGKAESYPVKCHGTNPEITKPHVANIIRRFRLPDGVL